MIKRFWKRNATTATAHHRKHYVWIVIKISIWILLGFRISKKMSWTFYDYFYVHLQFISIYSFPLKKSWKSQLFRYRRSSKTIGNGQKQLWFRLRHMHFIVAIRTNRKYIHKYARTKRKDSKINQKKRIGIKWKQKKSIQPFWHNFRNLRSKNHFLNGILT